MANKVRHVMGISGGKDSAALAIYLRKRYPELDIEYYFCDTGKELPETYNLITSLESVLGIKVKYLHAIERSSKDSFDHFLKMYGGYLPSSNARWCTKKLKLEPFEKFVGDDPVISYVGIRGDEDREGYISRKPNIQSIFPFRRNIWSEDVINKVLQNDNIPFLEVQYQQLFEGDPKRERVFQAVREPISRAFMQNQKLEALLNAGVSKFNEVVFSYLKTTNYPLAATKIFPLVENEDILKREDIFNLLRESGVGVPAYYEEKEYEVNGKKGVYARSRSGCYFCFFQQKIEWVWLFENHLHDFLKAELYEKDGYTWMQDETLRQLIGVPPLNEDGKTVKLCEIDSNGEIVWVNNILLSTRDSSRTDRIKENQASKQESKSITQSPFLTDLLEDSENEGCAACFI